MATSRCPPSFSLSAARNSRLLISLTEAEHVQTVADAPGTPGAAAADGGRLCGALLPADSAAVRLATRPAAPGLARRAAVRRRGLRPRRWARARSRSRPAGTWPFPCRERG